MAERERRVIASAIVLRAVDGEAKRLTGYAAVFNRETEIAGIFRERIEPGAFTEAVGRDDVRALFNHDPNFVLGRTASKTLTLREDAEGLAYDVVPPDTTWARDLLVTVARGDVTQSSFAFAVEADEWQRPANRAELPLRIIKRAKLYDVSPVTFPAYEDTTVAARSAAAACAGESADGLALVREADRLRFELDAESVLL